MNYWLLYNGSTGLALHQIGLYVAPGLNEFDIPGLNFLFSSLVHTSLNLSTKTSKYNNSHPHVHVCAICISENISLESSTLHK